MKVNVELCIVYDDVSKEAANGLFNKLYNRHNCMTWTKKEFYDNRTTSFKTMSNDQKIMYLSEELIQENLPKDMWELHLPITEYTSLVSIGNQYGIILDKVEIEKVPFLSWSEWWKYLISLVTTGILSIATAWYLWKNRKKNAVVMKKKKLYLDAISHLVKGDNIKKLFPEQ